MSTVRHGRRGEIYYVAICRPEQRNAVDGPTAHALFAAFQAFDADSSAKVAILHGEGGHFCAGADLKAFAAGGANPMEPTVSHLSVGPMGPSRMLCSKPVIAAIEGYAVAGGIELACWCDLRVAADDATLGVFCRRFGVPLIDGGTVRLPALIGLSRALDLILTGRAVTAGEALSIGLVNRVARRGEALAEAERLARELCSFPQQCMLADRSSAYNAAFSAASLVSALQSEFSGGVQVLTKESLEGARRFASGAGRHGNFATAAAPAAPRSGDSGNSGSDSTSAAATIRGVFFDLGGVVLDSPIHEIVATERALGLPQFAVNRLFAMSQHFHALEEGKITLAQFVPRFQAECDANALGAVNVQQLLDRMVAAAAKARKPMLHAIAALRKRGYKVVAVTNNWRDTEADSEGSGMATLKPHFDAVVQSCVIGERKPNRAIYEAALSAVGLRAPEVIFVDDIPRNVQAAKALGMGAVHVRSDYLVAIREIATKLGLPEDALLEPGTDKGKLQTHQKVAPKAKL